MTEPITPAVSPLDAPDLSVSAYRALRDGGDAAKRVEPPATTSAADAANADAGIAVETEETDANEETSQAKTEQPNKDKIASRFSELTAQIKDLKTQLAGKAGTGQTEQSQSATKTPEPVTVPIDPKDPEPDPKTFSDYTEWQKQWNRWDRRQEQRAEAKRTADAAAANAAKATATAWQTRVSEASKELKDFESVALNTDLPVTKVMGDAIVDSEVGPSILYELGKNPDEAKRISALSPIAQVREIGKLEAKLAKTAAAEDLEEKPQVVSKAPAPLKPVNGGRTSAAKQLESMNQSEYRALRESGKL